MNHTELTLSLGDESVSLVATVESSGGSEIDSIRKAYGTVIDLTKHTPARESYEFNGWYSDPDLAVILMRYMSFKEINIPVRDQWIVFADESDIADYAMDAIQTFYKPGIISGSGMDSESRAIINSNGKATRAEAASMLHRFLLKIAEA